MRGKHLGHSRKKKGNSCPKRQRPTSPLSCMSPGQARSTPTHFNTHTLSYSIENGIVIQPSQKNYCSCLQPTSSYEVQHLSSPPQTPAVAIKYSECASPVQSILKLSFIIVPIPQEGGTIISTF